MIRPAKIEDAPRIYELLKDILIMHKEMYPARFAGESKYTVEQVESLIQDETTIIFVSDNDGVDGYIILQDKFDVLYVDDLCVDKRKRGLNIGHQLMDVTMDYAEEHNYFEVQLNVWLRNVGALHFYEKLGFEPLRTIMTKEV